MLYELRIYTANPGKLPALIARFRDHTCTLFEKHGIKNVGYWTNLVVDDDGGALGRQQVGVAAAQAPAGAGDDGNFVLEQSHGFSFDCAATTGYPATTGCAATT